MQRPIEEQQAEKKQKLNNEEDHGLVILPGPKEPSFQRLTGGNFTKDPLSVVKGIFNGTGPNGITLVFIRFRTEEDKSIFDWFDKNYSEFITACFAHCNEINDFCSNDLENVYKKYFKNRKLGNDEKDFLNNFNSMLEFVNGIDTYDGADY
jgi:hypothetical protein